MNHEPYLQNLLSPKGLINKQKSVISKNSLSKTITKIGKKPRSKQDKFTLI
jgi:hypothetical protein